MGIGTYLLAGGGGGGGDGCIGAAVDGVHLADLALPYRWYHLG